MTETNHNHHTYQPPPPPPPITDKMAEIKDRENGKERETAILLDKEVADFGKKTDGVVVLNASDDMEEEEEEEYEEKLKKADCVGRQVLRLQKGVRTVIDWVNVKFKGFLFIAIFVLLYFIYFCYAMYYKFGGEPSVRLLWCTVLGVVIATRHKVYHVLSNTACGKWCSGEKSPKVASRIQIVRFFFRWFLYGAVGAFIGYVIVDVAIKDAPKLRSLPGIFVFLLICFLFSSNPSKINWHTIYWSLGMQFIMAVLVMRWEAGKNAIIWIQERLDSFFANSKPASELIFGPTYHDHYMVFGALPIVFLTNAVLSILYYVGAMQFAVKIIGKSLQFVLGTTPIESTGVAASIFMEGASAMLVLRPYLGKLTNSELFTLTTACLASIGGAFLAILNQLGISIEFLLPAMVISAPATFSVCKLMVPETQKPKKMTFAGGLPLEMQHSSILEAAQAGAISVVSLVANVLVTAFAFFALISFANNTLSWFGDRVGLEQLTMDKILSYIFWPFALLMGVELDDCRNVGLLMGLRISSSNFISLLKMQQLVGNRMQLQQYLQIPNATVTNIGDHIFLDQWNVTLIEGTISRRTEAIATYALCGFSGILSLFITISIMNTLVPKRSKWITAKAIPLLIAGNFANFMVGCFAGLLV